ncbi:peroxisome proliferator-activated receptor gamma coactivator-related protein 1 [Salvelinus fontinalis]|uniref:peroxisome proliferator-activated receptor gamma coactivator-related protein 1 n=1 Tax=Salvelinus fontinalis TaxID=8038 RepID=UPI00248589A4|nr:peroxisome proliferator-activated receptor gamma coactivator-related protein 1 [Salvelinus fontinalis]
MAARWGAGDEILAACNMEFFSTNTLDEVVNLHGGLSSESVPRLELDTGEVLEALHCCLDPSILSIFEDTPSGENKFGLDEVNQATLLTALTEILDNVDNENLSHFDTLPDSDLLSGQKYREHSPLRRLLCLSRSPPERETLCNTRQFSTGKSLPRTQKSVQRSDGEEEEDGEQELLNWDGLNLPLPLALEQHMGEEGEDGESMSVSLGELVRHMHPYCMAVCMENGEGEEQMLAEKRILLEVVDQGVHQESIFALPDMGLSLCHPSFSLPGVEDSSEAEQRVPNEVLEAAILETQESANDDVVIGDDPAEVAGPSDPAVTLRSEARGEKVINRRPKEETAERCPSRRKRKNKMENSPHEVTPEPDQAERRVLRRAAQESSSCEPVKETAKPKKKVKIKSLTSTISTAAPEAPKHKRRATHAAEKHVEVTTLVLPKQPSIKVMPASDLLPMTMTPEKVSQPTTACGKPQGPPASTAAHQMEAPQAMTINLPSANPVSVAPQPTMQPNIAPLVAHQAIPPQAIEPKPKPLSLQQYRLLRQQKKLAPLERLENQSVKWPILLEAPTELPPIPIPCLPTPSSRGPHPSPGKNEVEEVKAAWQPMGPGAPPTPEALLVPPAYMQASKSYSSSKVAIENVALTTPPQQAAIPTPQSSKARQLQPLISAMPASSTVKAIPSQTPSTKAQTLSVKCCIPQAPQPALSNPLLQSQLPSLKTVALIKSQSSSGASSKTTTDAHRSTLIAPIPQKPTPVATIVPKRTLNPNAAAVCVQKPTPALKVSTNLQKGVVALPQSRVPELPTITPVSAPAKPSNVQAFKPPVRCSPAQEAPKARSPTQEPIEAFTGEIGIEAADLTSLLEQFEETQAKEEQCVPEVSGRAAAVGNSSVAQPCDRTPVERVRAHDLTSTADLTPPATPPHQMWKPLVPIALLGKSQATEAPKPSPSKAIQIDTQPLPSNKLRSKPPSPPITPTPNPVSLTLAFSDHDYSLLQKEPMAIAREPGKRWNVKQQAAITIEPLGSNTTWVPQRIPAPSLQTLTTALGTKNHQAPLVPQPLHVKTDRTSSVLETPDASPTRLMDQAGPLERSPKKGRYYRSYNNTFSHRPSPSPREGKRGRKRKRSIHRSSSPDFTDSESDSSSQSRSRSLPRKRYRPRHSDSSFSASSCSSSRSSSRSLACFPRRRRYSYSSSRSGSWSRSRSRSPHRRAWSRCSRQRSPSFRPGYRPESRENSEVGKRLKDKAIDERRVVYVGRIRETMTHKELNERFSLYGEIEECTLHFRGHGDNYGFVTYYDTKDAFTAIENGSKLRKPDELPFDLCFGGRRQFCKTSYADLDSNREYDPSAPVTGKFDALDFDTLLKQAQKSLKR